MDIYQEFQGIASGLLKEFKQGVIKLVRIVPGNGPAYNPGASTSTDIPLDGAVCRGIQYKYVMQGLGVASDLQVTMPGNIGPHMTDFVNVDGTNYKIKQIINIPSAGTAVATVCIIAKG